MRGANLVLNTQNEKEIRCLGKFGKIQQGKKDATNEKKNVKTELKML